MTHLPRVSRSATPGGYYGGMSPTRGFSPPREEYGVKSPMKSNGFRPVTVAGFYRSERPISRFNSRMLKSAGGSLQDEGSIAATPRTPRIDLAFPIQYQDEHGDSMLSAITVEQNRTTQELIVVLNETRTEGGGGEEKRQKHAWESLSLEEMEKLQNERNRKFENSVKETEAMISSGVVLPKIEKEEKPEPIQQKPKPAPAKTSAVRRRVKTHISEGDQKQNEARASVHRRLDMKLNALREDPESLQLLRDRIAQAQAVVLARQARSNKIKINKETMSKLTFTKVVQQRQELLKAQREKQAQARQRHEQILQEDHNRKLYHANKREISKAKELEREKELAELEVLQSKQREFMTMVEFGLRIHYWLVFYESEKTKQFAMRTLNVAAYNIQKRFLDWRNRQFRAKYSDAMSVLKIYVGAYARHRRVLKRFRSAELISRFLHDTYESQKVTKVIRNYRFSVIKGQRAIRRWLAKHHYELGMLQTQWDKLEAVVYKRLGIGKPKTPEMKERPARRSSQPRNSMDAEPANDKDVRVASTVKKEMLKEVIRKRKKRFKNALAQYEEELAKWRREIREKSAIEQARAIAHGQVFNEATSSADIPEPKRPTEKLLLGREEMEKLIELGVTRTVEEAKKKADDEKKKRMAAMLGGTAGMDMLNM